MRILIDADPIVYEVGFAGEERWYELTWYPNGVEKTAWFYNKDRCNQFMELMHILPEESVVNLERESEPLPFVLATIKRKLNRIFLAIDGFLAETDYEADEYELFLTDGKTNYRNRIATIVPYKGNRDPNHKPIYYEEIRDYLVDKWGAKIMRGCEADDALSIEQHKQDHLFDTIIATIDKDLKMVPGLHYNYRSGKEFYVSRRDALEFFYKQILTGDQTDNIKGCYCVGAQAADKLIDAARKEAKKEKLSLYDYEVLLYQRCLELYQQSIDKHGAKTRYEHLGAEAALIENARLLWMQQWPNQLWAPPHEDFGTISYYTDD